MNVSKEYLQLLNNVYSELPEKAVSDERFRLPEIEIMHQGSKTIIRNFNTFLTAVRRPAEMVMKFLSRELAVPVNVEGGMLIIQGNIPDRLLRNKIELFVKMYVMCSVCGKPDTHIVEVEKGVHMLVCEACGARTPIRK